MQHGKTIFTLSASFHPREPGVQHADADAGRAAARLSSSPDRRAAAQAVRRRGEDFFRDNPIEIRHVGPLTAEARRDPALRSRQNLVWLKADGKLPDDPLLHVCLMTYASDITLLDTVLIAQGLSWADGLVSGASLDHAMWFHRPFRADNWLLYVQDSPSASGALGLARGEVYTEQGELVVSVVQEGLLRQRTPGG